MSDETKEPDKNQAQTTEPKTFWQCTKDFLKSFFKKLYEVAMPAVKSAVTEFLNDDDVQAAAKDAVSAAIARGLRGDDAWTSARDAFEAAILAKGKEVSKTLLDTALQNAYCAVKYAVTQAES